MKFEEILPALRAGKRVRRDEWSDFANVRIERQLLTTQHENTYVVTGKDLLATDWTIVDPEPEARTVTRWAVRAGGQWWDGLRWNRKHIRAVYCHNYEGVLNSAQAQLAYDERAEWAPVRFRVRKRGVK